MELKSQARNPVPSGPVVGAFRGYDGEPLRFARWDATQGPRRGTICLFHGRSEFIEKYFETIADLRRRGFAVATFDWRGQGASFRSVDNPAKGHIGDFAEYERDVVRFMKDVVLPDCPPPYIALAHSMGGNVMLRMASMRGCWFERMVLSTPMISIAAGELRHREQLVRIYAELSVLCGLSTAFVHGGNDRLTGTGEFEGNPLTSDRERWSRNKAILEVAPQLGLGSPTNGWLRAALRSCAKISAPDYARQVDVPVLLFAAGEDTVVSTPAIEELGVRLKIGAPALIAGSRHEILQERDRFRQKFWSVFDAYFGVTSVAA